LADFTAVQPIHMAAYAEELQAGLSEPTVKQHLAAIRMLFDWLVTGQAVPVSPASSVRGPRYSITKASRRCCRRRKRVSCCAVWMFPA